MSIHDQLDYLIEPREALCSLSSESHINHKYVDEEDFVDKYDHDSANAKEYGCGNMKADVKRSTPEVLAKVRNRRGRVPDHRFRDLSGSLVRRLRMVCMMGSRMTIKEQIRHILQSRGLTLRDSIECLNTESS